MQPYRQQQNNNAQFQPMPQQQTLFPTQQAMFMHQNAYAPLSNTAMPFTQVVVPDVNKEKPMQIAIAILLHIIGITSIVFIILGVSLTGQDTIIGGNSTCIEEGDNADCVGGISHWGTWIWFIPFAIWVVFLVWRKMQD